jgi:hypothetical protein
MIQRKAKSITFFWMFTEGKLGKTGLTVTANIYKGTNATPIVSNGSVTHLAQGVYYYVLSSGSVDTSAVYLGMASTATTSVDLREVPAAWYIIEYADEIYEIKEKTDNLPASPAAVGSAMTLADDAITAAKFDESTAFPLKSADTGATAVARTGADSDTLETLSDQIDTVKAKTDNIPTYPATEAKQDAIKAKTDLIPASPAAAGEYTANIAAIKGVTDKIDTAVELDGAVYRFTTNALEQAPTGGSAPTAEAIRQEMDANSTQLAAIVADTNELQTDLKNGGRLDLLVDAIKAKTDNIPASPAAAGEYTANIAAIKGVTDKIDTAVELDGAVYRFTTNALEQAPTGSGGTADWTAEERKQIRHRLGIDGDTSAPSQISSIVQSLALHGDTYWESESVLEAIAELKAIVDALTEDSDGMRFTAKALELATSGGIDLEAFAELVKDTVLDEVLTSHNVPLSLAVFIKSAAASGDSLSSVLPGDYSTGQAGFILYDLFLKVYDLVREYRQRTEEYRYAYRGDTWEELFDCGNLTGFGAEGDEIILTLKNKLSDVDQRSALQVSYSGGLLIVNGREATETDAELDIVGGKVQLKVEPAATKELRGKYYGDVQVKQNEVITTKRFTFEVIEDVTREI